MINKFQNSSIVKRIENTQNRMDIVNPQIVTNIVSKGRKVLDSLYNRPKPQIESTYVYTPVIDKIFTNEKIIKSERNGGILKRVESGKSGIHIKPENRGKFTALKKRTGKSSTWYKEHGTPAQKKMAVFALNAKKWKHK